MTHEQLRRSYKPKQVRLLFVGESPPASGRFFYAGDSGLYRAMLQVFECVDAGISNETFLEVFQASGCYLVDLCPTPVDRLTPTLRRAARASNEESLAITIYDLDFGLARHKSRDANVRQRRLKLHVVGSELLQCATINSSAYP